MTALTPRPESEFRARSLGCGGWTIRCRWNEEPRFTAILHTHSRKFIGRGDTEAEACKVALTLLAEDALRINRAIREAR